MCSATGSRCICSRIGRLNPKPILIGCGPFPAGCSMLTTPSVPFTGRDDELADLRRWRDDNGRLGVRWLHGPGGQGKTRLAAQFAAECKGIGWKVIVAFHGPDADRIISGGQDMSLDGAAGLLVVVDYADRWRVTSLTWLFKNSLLQRAERHHQGAAAGPFRRRLASDPQHSRHLPGRHLDPVPFHSAGGLNRAT